MGKVKKSRPRAKSAPGTPKKPSQAAVSTDPVKAPARWTFLTNHSHVLILLHRDPSMVLREVSLRIGITERAVQRIIADLEEEGFIKREKLGRRNHYQIFENMHLRHAIEEHRTIGELLNLIDEDVD